MANAGTGAGTVLLVVGALAMVIGLVLLLFGPGLIDGGTEDSFGGGTETTEKGRAIQMVGWAVGGSGAVLILVGTGVLVAGRRSGTS